MTRLNKFSLKEGTSSKLCTEALEKLQIKNATAVYQFVNIFNLSNKTALRYIERCFTIVCDTDNFIQMDYNSISKILGSSSLFLTSEIEVFKVAEKWLSYNIEERIKYAKNLLLKVRLSLLSKDTIRQLLNNSAFLNNDDSCIEFLSEVLESRVSKLKKSSSIYHTTRYCAHKSFRLLVCGGYNSNTNLTCGNVSCIDVDNLGNVEAYRPMITERDYLKVVYVKSSLYIFGGYIIPMKKE